MIERNSINPGKLSKSPERMTDEELKEKWGKLTPDEFQELIGRLAKKKE